MRGSGKGTGSRGIQITPRSDSYIDNFDGIFRRPSEVKGIFRPWSGFRGVADILEESEEDEDGDTGLSNFRM
jgi:hypothetical protein